MMRLWDILGRMPSTNTRIAVSLLLAFATGIATIVRWTPPPWEWLVALTAWLGIDAAQFVAKRQTYREPGPGR